MDITKFNKSSIILVGGLIILIICFIIVTTIYTFIENKIPNNKKSQNRLSQLTEIFQSFFGTKWPYLLFLILILILFILIILYSQINVTLSDKYSKITLITLVIFIILFMIFIIMSFVQSYLKQKTKNKTGDISDYNPYSDSTNNNAQILLAVGLSILVLFILIIVIGFITKKIHF